MKRISLCAPLFGGFVRGNGITRIDGVFISFFFNLIMFTNNPLLPANVHSSWEAFLTDEIRQILSDIAEVLSHEKEFTPPLKFILRFLELDLSSMKVVILGQDPYPQKGIATGRAFEVGALQSWHDSFRNSSLRNIVRALYFMEKGETAPLTYTQIKKELVERRFKIFPPNQLFKHWESQGVLLLNTSFSCRIGDPGSHSSIWLPFTQRLLTYINEQQPHIYWLLWGAHAQKIVGHLNLKNVMTSHHPMICSQRENDFLFGKTNHFRELREVVDWGVGN